MCQKGERERNGERRLLTLEITPALSGLAGPTYRCYAKKPTLPLGNREPADILSCTFRLFELLIR